LKFVLTFGYFCPNCRGRDYQESGSTLRATPILYPMIVCQHDFFSKMPFIVRRGSAQGNEQGKIEILLGRLFTVF
jgi:hypothetical protein